LCSRLILMGWSGVFEPSVMIVKIVSKIDAYICETFLRINIAFFFIVK
jgi:hypothetical protein